MRRVALVGLLSAVAVTGACSLLNNPDPIQPGGEGGGGGSTTTTTTTTTTGTGGTGGATTTTSSSSGMTGGGGAGGGCTGNEQCVDLNAPCIVGVCNNGVCEPKATDEGKACDDGAYCTVNDKCKQGVCAGTARVCQGDPQNPCVVGHCNENADSCELIAGNDNAGCDDKNPCTLGDACAGGSCVAGNQLKDCSSFDSDCSVGKCDPQKDPVNGCYAAAIKEGQACDLFNSCATSTCVNGQCKNSPIDALQDLPCDDNKFCTVNETCQNGFCVAGQGSPCASNDACGSWACNEAKDTCEVTPIAVNDAKPCTPFYSCLSGSKCQSGICEGGTGPKIFFSETFKDNSKGWTLGPEWQIAPAKNSPPGTPGFKPDPAVDHTEYDVGPGGDLTPSYDNGVAGVQIGGNANTAVHAMSFLESPMFDTSSAQGSVILGFYRWLNSDYPASMPNVLQVQNGQGNWVTIWQSADKPATTLAENKWEYQQFDITVYKSNKTKLRWGFAVAKLPVFTVSSWNIDDVIVASAGCP